MKQEQKTMVEEVGDELMMAEISHILASFGVTNQKVIAVGIALIETVIAKLKDDRDETDAELLEFVDKLCHSIKTRLEGTIYCQSPIIVGEA